MKDWLEKPKIKTTSLSVSEGLKKVGYDNTYSLCWINGELHFKPYLEQLKLYSAVESIVPSYEFEVILGSLLKVEGFNIKNDGDAIVFNYSPTNEAGLWSVNRGYETLADTAAMFLLKLHKKGVRSRR